MPELAFAVYLVLIFPAQQLWRSLQPPKPPSATRYFKTIQTVGIMLAVLAALMWHSGRGFGELGLDIPVSMLGQWGLAICAVLLIGAIVYTWWWERGLTADKRTEYHDKLDGHDGMPRSQSALRAFVLTTLVLGIGWELLYRGFLMLVLPPLTGTAGAVILASLAYGLGHGYKSRGQLAGSVVSAFLFTIGYVVTQSLWWLMVLHVLLPLYAGVASYSTLKAAGRLDTAAA